MEILTKCLVDPKVRWNTHQVLSNLQVDATKLEEAINLFSYGDVTNYEVRLSATRATAGTIARFSPPPSAPLSPPRARTKRSR